MPEHTDWQALARARSLNIPEEAITRIAPSLEALHLELRALLKHLPHSTEPAITLSEQSVLGEKVGE